MTWLLAEAVQISYLFTAKNPRGEGSGLGRILRWRGLTNEICWKTFQSRNPLKNVYLVFFGFQGEGLPQGKFAPRPPVDFVEHPLPLAFFSAVEYCIFAKTISKVHQSFSIFGFVFHFCSSGLSCCNRQACSWSRDRSVSVSYRLFRIIEWKLEMERFNFTSSNLLRDLSLNWASRNAILSSSWVFHAVFWRSFKYVVSVVV